MNQPLPNQPGLWCRVCSASHDSFDADGVCDVCETPNVARFWRISFPIVSAYTPEEALMTLQEAMELDAESVLGNMNIEILEDQ